jgi:hypothetical protein
VDGPWLNRPMRPACTGPVWARGVFARSSWKSERDRSLAGVRRTVSADIPASEFRNRSHNSSGHYGMKSLPIMVNILAFLRRMFHYRLSIVKHRHQLRPSY